MPWPSQMLHPESLLEMITLQASEPPMRVELKCKSLLFWANVEIS